MSTQYTVFWCFFHALCMYWRKTDTQLFLKSQHKTDIFSCVLFHFFRQTNDDKKQNDPEDNLLSSRIQSLHFCLEVDFHDEEDWSVSSTLDNWKENISVFQYQSKFCPQQEKFSWMSWPKYVFVVLLWPLIDLQNHLHSIFNAYSSNCISEVSCSLSSSSLSIKSVTNSSKPREILTHEWELSLFTDSTLFSTRNWLWLPTRAQCWCSLESNLSDQIFFILTKCTHDKPLILWIVRILQCLSSWNTVRLQLFPGILHQYKIWLLGLVVRAFPLVLCILAIDILYVQEHHSKVCLSWSHLARTMDSIVLSQRVFPFFRDKIHFLHTFLRLHL